MTLSEEELSTIFQEFIENNSFNIRKKRPHHCVEEFDALQGRADYVLSPTDIKSAIGKELTDKIVSGIDSPSAALIVSTIIKMKKATVEEIKEECGLSNSTVRKCVSNLSSLHIIEECGKKQYRKSTSFKLPEIELWAIELKLHDWKRALFQSLQYRAFSHCSIIVVPKETSQLIMQQEEIFKQYNVGVMAIDCEKFSLKTLIPIKTTKPFSSYNYIYAISLFLKRLYDKDLHQIHYDTPVEQNQIYSDEADFSTTDFINIFC